MKHYRPQVIVNAYRTSSYESETLVNFFFAEGYEETINFNFTSTYDFLQT